MTSRLRITRSKVSFDVSSWTEAPKRAAAATAGMLRENPSTTTGFPSLSVNQRSVIWGNRIRRYPQVVLAFLVSSSELVQKLDLDVWLAWSGGRGCDLGRRKHDHCSEVECTGWLLGVRTEGTTTKPQKLRTTSYTAASRPAPRCRARPKCRRRGGRGEGRGGSARIRDLIARGAASRLRRGAPGVRSSSMSSGKSYSGVRDVTSCHSSPHFYEFLILL